MKLIIVLITAALLNFCSACYAQNITLNKQDISLAQLFQEIKKQTGYDFIYSPKMLENANPVNVNVKGISLKTVLDSCFAGQPLTYAIDQNTIIVKKKASAITSNIKMAASSSLTITGRVINHDDKKPVANASVFLSNASIGAKTTDDGSFVLRNAKPGKYYMVVSVVGFAAYSQSININDINITLPDIEISPKAIALKEVSIKPKSDIDRGRNLNWFENEFLGTTDLAGECKILNPDVIDLDYDMGTGVLTGSSYDFIEIENDALGYKIKYLLTNFSLNKKDPYNKKIHYEGSALYAEMKGTPSQERLWQKRRQDVYLGSEMHFLRSALNNRIDEEGFRVLRKAVYPKKLGSSKMISKLMPFPLKTEDIISPTNQEGVYAFGCANDALYIAYDKKHNFIINDNTAYLDVARNTESTLVSFNTPYTFFDNNGGIINPNSVSLRGVWGRERIAGLLPVDYEPQNDNSANNNVSNPIASNQTGSLKDDLLKFTADADSLTGKFPAEKLYMQFDKSYYAIGDTIWLKGWLFNAPTLGLSAKSGILYIDITNEKDTIVKQYKLPVQNGITWGNISLDSIDFKAGTYTIHAYTNWMRNFGESGFFSRQFYITDPNEGSLLVNTQTAPSASGVNASTGVKLQFTNINKTPFANEAMQLQVMAENKRLNKQKLTTNENGLLDLNFTLPGKGQDVSIIAETDKGRTIIPLHFNSDQNADIQFLPEGGDLVDGLPAHISFKAIGSDGKGINISGVITDHNKQQAAVFQSLHNGMGSFDLGVKTGESYTARVTLPGGAVKEYALPVLKNSGTVLQVKNKMEIDSTEIIITATNDIVQSGKSYFLIGKARGVTCYAAVIDFKNNNNYIRKAISNSLFPSGIAHFILTTSKGQPLNERLFYIAHNDNLHIQVTTDKPVYVARDSISLHLKVTDNDGTPVSGNFSLAVTDNRQIVTDTIKQENMISHILLLSDLKGYVEDPGYYFQTKTPKSWQALDNLLLTQGWVNYDLQTDKEHSQYPAEDELTVSGQVFNGFNKPLKSIKVDLFSKSPLFVKDTLTNKTGRFTFVNFPRVDTPAFVIKTANRNFNEVIKMDETPPPVFSATYPVLRPWYINSDSAIINYTKNRDSINKQPDYLPDGRHRLKEVKIVAQKVVKDSENPNGPGNADIVLDEKDLEKAGKKTLLQLLQEKIKGFRAGSFLLLGNPNNLKVKQDRILSRFVTDSKGYPLEWYFIYDKPVKFIVDGTSIYKMFNIPSSNGVPEGFSYASITDYLKYYSAEDVKGIEVNISSQYTSKYVPPQFAFYISPQDVDFIEITTRAGNGPSMPTNGPGMYLYKPVPLSWPVQFYKPKYEVNDTTKHSPDLRSTIDWEPNVVTDQKGEASVSFYAADTPLTYTIIIEGTDGNGNLGYKMQRIIFDKQKPGGKSK